MTAPDPEVPERRLLLSLAAGSVLLPATGSATETPVHSGGHAGLAEANEPKALLRALRRLRYAEAGELSFWWLRATKYGLVDGRLTPIFGMEIGNVARTDDLPDGFAATTLEIVFFTDIATGRRTESIRNPYTGELLPRQDSLVGPTTVRYRTGGTEYPAELPGVKLSIEPKHVVFAVEGDDVWVRDDTDARVIGADGRPQFWVADWAAYHGSRTALADPGLRSVPATVSFNSTSSWLAWLRMGDRPGYLMSRGNGRKYARITDLPASFLDILKERYPAIVADPAAALAKPAHTFAP